MEYSKNILQYLFSTLLHLKHQFLIFGFSRTNWHFRFNLSPPVRRNLHRFPSNVHDLSDVSVNRTTSKSAELTIREPTGPKFFTTRDVKEALLFVTPFWKADRAMELVYLPLTWTRDRATEGFWREGSAFVETWQAAPSVFAHCVYLAILRRETGMFQPDEFCRTNDRFGGFTRKITFPIKHEYSWTEGAFENFVE